MPENPVFSAERMAQLDAANQREAARQQAFWSAARGKPMADMGTSELVGSPKPVNYLADEYAFIPLPWLVGLSKTETGIACIYKDHDGAADTRFFYYGAGGEEQMAARDSMFARLSQFLADGTT